MDCPPVAQPKILNQPEDAVAVAAPKSTDGEDPFCYFTMCIRGLERDFDLCKKPKCRALRSFILARFWALAKDNKLKGQENIASAFHHLDQYHPEDEEGKARKKVLGLMVSRFEAALTAGVFDCPKEDDAGSVDDRSIEEDGSHSSEKDVDEEDGEDDPMDPVFDELQSPLEKAMYYYLKGKYAGYTHHFDTAVAYFLKSLKESPESTFALVALGSYARIDRRVVDRFVPPDPDDELMPFQKKWELTGDARAAARLAVVKLEMLRNSRNSENAKPDATAWETGWGEILRLAAVVEEHGEKSEDLTHCADIFAASPKLFGVKRRAEALFRRSLQLCPSSTFTHHKLGKYLVLRGKIEEGLAHLRQAIDLAVFGGNFAAHMDYICIRYCTEEDFDADVEFERLREIKEYSTMKLMLFVMWAQYKAAKCDFEAALQLLAKAAKMEERNHPDGCPSGIKYDPFPTSQWAYLVKTEDVSRIAHPQQIGPTGTGSRGWETQASNLLWRKGAADGRNDQTGSRGFLSNAGWNGDRRGNSWRGAGARDSHQQHGNIRSSQQERRQFTPRKTLAEIREEIEQKAKRSR